MDVNEKEKLGHLIDKLRLKCVMAQQKQNNISRSDVLQRELLRGKEEAYWDAVCEIEEEFGRL